MVVVVVASGVAAAAALSAVGMFAAIGAGLVGAVVVAIVVLDVVWAPGVMVCSAGRVEYHPAVASAASATSPAPTATGATLRRGTTTVRSVVT